MGVGGWGGGSLPSSGSKKKLMGREGHGIFRKKEIFRNFPYKVGFFVGFKHFRKIFQKKRVLTGKTRFFQTPLLILAGSTPSEFCFPHMYDSNTATITQLSISTKSSKVAYYIMMFM